MITSVELIELLKLINGEHGDPHQILGMHSLLFKNIAILTVRVYIPQARTVDVYDPLIPDKRYKLEKVHDDGFFEGRIHDRNEWFRYEMHVKGSEGNEWTAYDPYSFEPTLSDMDRYLISEGTHYEIFNKLGAHLIELDGISGAAFSVWAPNAMRVSVIGEFNCWDNRRNQMRNLSGSGIWEIFIPGLVEFDEYKFEIKTKTGAFIQKSDPYSFYMANNLETQSALFDIDKYKWSDMDWLTRSRSKAEPINIYEVHIGSWRRPSGYLHAAESMIDYVKKLGYTHIELLPIQEHTSLSTLGYQITSYYAPTSRYGKPDELMRFIDLCHCHGIGVILDWTPTHFPLDNHSLARFDGTPLYERMGVRTIWNTNMFDYSKKEVKNFLLGNALFWIEKYHVDGLRINNLRYLGLDAGIDYDAIEFIKHLNSIIKKRYAQTLMIAEDTGGLTGVTRTADEDGLGFSLMWKPGWMESFLSYMTTEPENRTNQQNRSKLEYCFKRDIERTVLPISHDDAAFGRLSLFERMPGNFEEKISNLKLALAVMMGCPGYKLIFMGLEFANNEPWDIVKGLNWDIANDKHRKRFQKFVKDLNIFYKDDKALWDGHGDKQSKAGHETEKLYEQGWLMSSDAQPGIFSVERRSNNNKNFTIFVYNFTQNTHDDYMLRVPYEGLYKEVINSDSKAYGGNSESKQKLSTGRKKDADGEYTLVMKLPALSAVILKPVRKRDNK